MLYCLFQCPVSVSKRQAGAGRHSWCPDPGRVGQRSGKSTLYSLWPGLATDSYLTRSYQAYLASSYWYGHLATGLAI